MNSAAAQVSHGLSSISNGARTAFHNSVNAIRDHGIGRELAERMRDSGAHIREALSAFKPAEVYDRVFIFFVTEGKFVRYTISHAYAPSPCLV